MLCSAAQDATLELTALGTAKVPVLDGGTLMLDDGRELRLAGSNRRRQPTPGTLAGSQPLRLERLGPE